VRFFVFGSVLPVAQRDHPGVADEVISKTSEQIPKNVLTQYPISFTKVGSLSCPGNKPQDKPKYESLANVRIPVLQ